MGYHPNQPKIVTLELDKLEKKVEKISLLRLFEKGGFDVIKKEAPKEWGKYLRFNY